MPDVKAIRLQSKARPTKRSRAATDKKRKKKLAEEGGDDSEATDREEIASPEEKERDDGHGVSESAANILHQFDASKKLRLFERPVLKLSCDATVVIYTLQRRGFSATGQEGYAAARSKHAAARDEELTSSTTGHASAVRKYL
eukprot:CAMPEP_0184504730 /NCGR_PEP_ID=MMETSP0113_2-20130426/52616_1 /TAXON_ID=91329 /ORGANISM="Norrisiella sphaerica, Strain BC52" /LENGTH=142 /DNA_ID=CAMNT_0026894387 /DNA_START=1009 /DNA_END=1432 /DNA_ORIENTATION=+